MIKTRILFTLIGLLAICMEAPTLADVQQRSAGVFEQAVQFESNVGQADPGIQFLARGLNSTLLLTRNGPWLNVRGNPASGQSTSVGLTFVHGDFSRAPEALEEQPGKVNYLEGNNSSLWLTNISTFSRVRYREIYPGVDAVFYGRGRMLEYDLIVQPGADLDAILLRFDGADRITVDADGDLEIGVGKTSIRQHKPAVYQDIGGQRRELAGAYRLHSGMQVGIAVGDYDKSQPLVIDPVLNYSATFGGSGVNNAFSVAVDTNGSVYITGNTTANNFPTKGAFQATFAGNQDAFVTKLDTNGVVVYSTYLGGGILNNINQASSGQAVAVDYLGNAVVAGWTQVTNFPVKNAWQDTNGGGVDGFVTQLNAAGNGLVFSTYLGGRGLDAANGVAVDTNGDVLVTGYTESTNFPTVAAAQASYGGNGDAFVAKLSSRGSNLVFCTYLGGSNSENNAGSGLLGFPSTVLPLRGGAIAVDFEGDAYVTGWTFSTNFPTVAAYQPVNDSGLPNYDPEAFLTKVGPSGTFIYSTYFGGAGTSYGSVYGRAVGVNGNRGTVYLAGSSATATLPITNAVQSFAGQADNQIGDGFIAAFDSTGTNLVYCTYLGGSGDDQVNGLSVRLSDGAVSLVGSSSSPDFPLAQAVQTNGKQGFFSSSNGAGNWNSIGAALSGSATVYGILVDPFNSAVVYVMTRSGLYKSLNRGDSWIWAANGLGFFSPPLSGPGNNDLAADPLHPNVLYVGCYDGVFKSTNGAATWFPATNGLPANPDIQTIALDRQSPSTIYAGTYSHGLYKSVDGGNSWLIATNGLNNSTVTALLVDPLNSSNILAGVQNYNNNCLYKSTNGAAGWFPVTGMPADPFGEHTIVAFGGYGSSIFAIVGNIIEDANLDVSTNGGTTWSSALLGQGLKFKSLAVGAPSVATPSLSIAQYGNKEVLTWPAALTNYSLQFAASLTSPNWQPIVNNGKTSVTNPVAGVQGFYRLVGTSGSSSSMPTVYLGTDATAGWGMLKSVDGGGTWSSVGFAGDTVSAVAVNPAEPAQVYAGLGGKNTTFVATLDPTGHLYFSSFLGGTGNDSGNAIALLNPTSLVCVGTTSSTDFPTNSASPSVVSPKSKFRKPKDFSETVSDLPLGEAVLFFLSGAEP